MISFRSDDLNSLLSVVNQRAALAYVADVAIDLEKFRVIDVVDFSNEYKENYALVYRASTAAGWLNQLISGITKMTK